LVTNSSGYLILKTDTNGNEIWKTFYANSDKNSQLEFIDATTDKVSSLADLLHKMTKMQMIFDNKFDSLGNVIWQKNYGFFKNEAAHCIRQTLDGGYIVSGDKQESNTFNYDNYLVKLDKNGDKEWDLIMAMNIITAINQ